MSASESDISREGDCRRLYIRRIIHHNRTQISHNNSSFYWKVTGRKPAPRPLQGGQMLWTTNCETAEEPTGLHPQSAEHTPTYGSLSNTTIRIYIYIKVNYLICTTHQNLFCLSFSAIVMQRFLMTQVIYFRFCSVTTWLNKSCTFFNLSPGGSFSSVYSTVHIERVAEPWHEELPWLLVWTNCLPCLGYEHSCCQRSGRSLWHVDTLLNPGFSVSCHSFVKLLFGSSYIQMRTFCALRCMCYVVLVESGCFVLGVKLFLPCVLLSLRVCRY